MLFLIRSYSIYGAKIHWNGRASSFSVIPLVIGCSAVTRDQGPVIEARTSHQSASLLLTPTTAGLCQGQSPAILIRMHSAILAAVEVWRREFGTPRRSALSMSTFVSILGFPTTTNSGSLVAQQVPINTARHMPSFVFALPLLREDSMTNFQDPAVVFSSARALVLSVHTIFGTYLWEYLTSLWFDWEYVTRARKLGFASAMYLMARYATLASLIVALRVVNAVEPINCTAWNYLLYAFAFSGVAFTSMLLFLRVVAVSGRNKTVVAIFAIFYGGNWLAVIYGIYNSSAIYMPALSLCYATDLGKHKPNTFVQFAFDFACLIAMLYYLTRGSREDTSLRNLMFNQGVIYFVCMTMAYGLATVFLFLDLNDPISQIPNLFALAMMSICSTRMHRLLVTEKIGVSAKTSPPPRPMSVVALGASLPTARSPKVHSVSMPVPRIQVHRATTATTDDGKKLSDEDLYTLAKLDGSRPGTARRDSEPFADV